MSDGLGHRVRWALAGVFAVAWFVALLFGWGGSAASVLLVAAAAIILYELLAAERGSA